VWGIRRGNNVANPEEHCSERVKGIPPFLDDRRLLFLSEGRHAERLLFSKVEKRSAACFVLPCHIPCVKGHVNRASLIAGKFIPADFRV
jgi:hypothetical protein